MIRAIPSQNVSRVCSRAPGSLLLCRDGGRFIEQGCELLHGSDPPPPHHFTCCHVQPQEVAGGQPVGGTVAWPSLGAAKDPQKKKRGASAPPDADRVNTPPRALPHLDALFPGIWITAQLCRRNSLQEFEANEVPMPYMHCDFTIQPENVPMISRPSQRCFRSTYPKPPVHILKQVL